MPDKISDEERRLIDNAVARGKVTRCPDFQALEVCPDYIWNEKSQRLEIKGDLTGRDYIKAEIEEGRKLYHARRRWENRQKAS